jgi:DNA-binding response OmpR family regulator
MNIILIEPDRVLADTYRLAFEAAGHTAVMCASAQSAVFAADEIKPDIVIMELQLIGHSGIEFLYEFRSYTEWQNVPVMLLTNVPAGEFADSWELLREELGVSAYYYKPLTTLQTLIRAVNEFVSSPSAILKP